MPNQRPESLKLTEIHEEQLNNTGKQHQSKGNDHITLLTPPMVALYVQQYPSSRRRAEDNEHSKRVPESVYEEGNLVDNPESYR